MLDEFLGGGGFSLLSQTSVWPCRLSEALAQQYKLTRVYAAEELHQLSQYSALASPGSFFFHILSISLLEAHVHALASGNTAIYVDRM